MSENDAQQDLHETSTRTGWLAEIFSRLKISSKLLVVLVVFVASSIGAFGAVEYRSIRVTLGAQALNHLTAVREAKALQIEDYFGTISNQVVTLSENETVVQAMREFELSFAESGQQDLSSSSVDPGLLDYYRDDYLPRLAPQFSGELEHLTPEQFLPRTLRGRELQQLFISDNPYPTGEKHLLDDPNDGGAYGVVHQRYHPTFRSFLERFGYYDIFLVDAQSGNIVYSVFKEVDFGTSLLTGPYSGTNFARAFAASRNASRPDFTHIEDFEPYNPSYFAPASFISSPIFDGNELIGVLVFQMPVDRINNIMTSGQAWSSVGLGESGESYIVGDDFLMRSQSRFLIEDRENYLQMIRSSGLSEQRIRQIDTFNSSVGMQPVETPGVRAALTGQVGAQTFDDYRGVSVLSSYRLLEIPGVTWAIMSEIDAAEALAPAFAFRQRMLVVFGLFMIAIGIAAYLLSRTMTRPINALAARADELAQGRLDVPIDTHGGDEIAQLARSFDRMRHALRELIESLEDKVAERTEGLRKSELRIRTIFENAADGIIVIGTDGIIQDFSPSAERIFGHSADDIIDKKIDLLMSEPMRSAHDSYLNHYLETGEKRVIGRNREVYGLRKDGSEFPLELAVGEALMGSDRVFIGLVRDITERKEAEQAINQVYQIIDQAPVNVFVRDAEGLFTYVNANYEKFHGLSRAQIYGKTLAEVFPGEAERFSDDDAKLISQGGVTETEEHSSDNEGNDVMLQQLKFAILDLEGKNVAVAGIDLDITERHKLERALEIANKRMGDELNIGRQIQMSMIPLTFPRFPEHKDLDVWAFIRPAREVGGDFYDFFFIDENHFAFVIADVSGKGVPAALFMAVTKTLLKSHSQSTKSTARIVQQTNSELSENNKDCMFITAFFAIINTKTGEMTYTNAGHNPPYLLRPNGEVRTLDTLHGPMIGVMEGVRFEQSEVTLDIDDKLFLFTDGVTEAFNESGEMFSDDRLTELLNRSSQLGTKYLIDHVASEVDSFAGEADQSDDITMFCLRHVAWDIRDDRARIELHLDNQMTEIDRCLEALSEFCERFELSAETENSIATVLDDLLNNVISYAYDDNDEHLIEVTIATDKQRMIVTVTDDGTEFDPFSTREPDIDAELNERQLGGLGIHLVRQLMDDFSYRRIGEKNVTILMKRLGD